MIAGVIFDPIHNDLFTAEKGQGALLNGRKLAVSSRHTLEESMVAMGNPRLAIKSNPAAAALFAAVTQCDATTRYFGAAALDLAYLAAGRIDACWHHTIQPWDIAAGILLVQEAGGLVTDLSGKPATACSSGILGSNRHLHLPMQKLLARAA